MGEVYSHGYVLTVIKAPHNRIPGVSRDVSLQKPFVYCKDILTYSIDVCGTLTRCYYGSLRPQPHSQYNGEKLTDTFPFTITNIEFKVGNDFIRGISGGERKRVSIAEA